MCSGPGSIVELSEEELAAGEDVTVSCSVVDFENAERLVARR